MFPAFLTTLLFSLSAVSANRATRFLGGTEANFWRLIFATLLLGLYAHSFGFGVAGIGFTIFFLSGCIGFGIGDGAYFQALPRLGSRLSVMLVLCLSSPIAAMIEWFWIHTALSGAEIFWGLAVLIGVAIALSPGKHLNLTSKELVPGVAFGLLAAFCQALGAVLSRKAFAMAGKVHANGIDGITAAYQRILGGMMVTALVLVLVKRRAIAAALLGEADSKNDRREHWRKAWPWLLCNALAGPALGVSCFQWALKTTPTGVVMPIVAITPLVIIPFSRYLEGELPTLRSLAGGLVAVISAVALAIVSSR